MEQGIALLSQSKLPKLCFSGDFLKGITNVHVSYGEVEFL